jgi:hypothetical protein
VTKPTLQDLQDPESLAAYLATVYGLPEEDCLAILQECATHVDGTPDVSFDALIKVITSSKPVFWEVNASFPEVEIQRLWQLRWNCVFSRIDAT